MKWTGLNELREQFLSFFESKGHTRLPSYPLVPIDDKSLLLINSGMAPMKKFFLGMETPPNRRVTTCQKCIRTPDIDNIGHTARHGTYFEMLGNFSFGDYFKKEATAWAWEFLTQVLEIPVDRLWVSIYQDDDEAFDIWTKQVGVAPDRIVRLGKEDNFWEHGSGPCGPCSEIYFDRGPEYGCGKSTCGVGCDCDRYMEIWNLVFSQYDSDGEGHYELLSPPNIDTGMGLERLACVMQNVGNLFEVDTVQNIMKHISAIAGAHYGESAKEDISLRVITDHIRSTTFMVGDGVVPSNEGRGYVLRRLLRRAARHGRLLGIDHPFLYQVCETVIAENASAYPELVEKKDYIIKVLKVEEERFSKTIDQGMEILNSIMDKISADQINQAVFSGEDAFRLYDTFGFPIDLTKEILAERGLPIDEEGFFRLMGEQKKRARDARKDVSGWDTDEMLDVEGKVKFIGYEKTRGQGKILALLDEDGKPVDSLTEGMKATVVLDSTPFYAESGGQVGDSGVIVRGKSIFQVKDCKKAPTGQFLHLGVMKSGLMNVGDGVETAVDEERRVAIMRNHTACHLLQAALRQVLGTHVQQAGSMVDEHRCRFDFTHFSAMTPEEIARTEEKVNQLILGAYDVTVTEMPIAEAKKLGAMALFGEKYGETVRVCNVSGKSVELCGGTHISNTARIGLFKIISESSVAAGVRRIEAATGANVLELIRQDEALLARTCESLKAGSPSELPQKAEAITAQLKEKEKEIETLQHKIADMRIEGLFENAMEVKGCKVIFAGFTGTSPDAVKAMCDQVRANAPKMVAVFASILGEKATVFAACGDEAVKKGAHAGNLIRQLTAKLGGKGGGRPEQAQGGVADIFKIDEALAEIPTMLEKMIQD